MADRGDTHYNLRSVNRVFLVTALALMVTAVWMVLDDWDRPWKDYQREFRSMELERAQRDLAEIQTPDWKAERQRLEQAIASVQQQMDTNAEYQRAHAEMRDLEGQHYRSEAEFKIAQAKFNWSKYLLNEANAKAESAVPDDELRNNAAALDQARMEMEQAKRAYEQSQARLATLTTEHDQFQAELDELMREYDLVDTKITGLHPGVFNKLRDFPGLDFVAPTITVRKQVLPGLRKNYNFNTVQRVDMCSTCHVAIDVAGYEQTEEPLRTHPRLDLFMGSSSPHPIEKFGCTVCHEGAAETLDFVRAVHMPDDEEQAHEWEEKYHWHRYHYWDWPMLPSKYTEAGCYSCHSMGGTLENIAPDAPRLTRGLNLMEQYGCYSCHNIMDWRDNRKPGPSLRNIERKIDESFARSWIANPHQFRESTWMPQFFHLENSVSKVWDDTTIAAIQTYLWSVAEDEPILPLPEDLADEADAERGEALFKQVGCTGCHNSPVTPQSDYSEFGPDLGGIGSKLGEAWLYAWIMDPKAWWPETRMPDLRLEPQDAADIARYLSTLKKDGWEPIPVDYDPIVLDQQAEAFLERRFSIGEAREQLNTWKEEGQDKVLAEVGKRWISRQGCYSCHDIPGFETSMPIGTDLSDWGNKNVHQLAFELWNEAVPGHFEGARDMTRHDFAELKLSNPRRFDRGLEVGPLDRLRMPDYKLDEEEIEAITTVLLGLKDDRKLIVPEKRPHPDDLEKALDRGAYLVRTKNCYGCHKFEMDTLVAESEAGDILRFHGLTKLEDEDEEATYFQLWKTAPTLAAEEGAESAQIGETAEVYWLEENEDGDLVPWPVRAGRGGGIMEGLAAYYEDSGEADEGAALPLLPPILYREGEKVRAPWVTQFLLQPYTLRPWLKVRMPTFSLTEEEARSIAVYFGALSVQEWPSRYARALRAADEMTLEEFAAETGVRADQIVEIESGGRFNENAFSKLRAWGDAQGFQFDPPPTLPFEEIMQRSPAYLAEREEEVPGWLEKGSAIIGPQPRGIDCYACHIRDGKTPGGDPLSWGPDLSYARNRLRPAWIRQWITNAQLIYPGTKMPTALGLFEDPKLQDVLEGPPERLIHCVVDYLMNSDRVSSEVSPQTGK